MWSLKWKVKTQMTAICQALMMNPLHSSHTLHLSHRRTVKNMLRYHYNVRSYSLQPPRAAVNQGQDNLRTLRKEANWVPFCSGASLNFPQVNIKYGSFYTRPCVQSKVTQYDDPEFRQDHLRETTPQRGMWHLRVKVPWKWYTVLENSAG